MHRTPRLIAVCLLGMFQQLCCLASDSRPVLKDDLNSWQEIRVRDGRTLRIAVRELFFDGFIGSIKVDELRPGKAPLTHQILDLGKICRDLRGAEVVAFNDYNFDGILDLELSCWAGATGNVGGVVLLYAPAQHQFVSHPDLNRMFGAQPDPRNRLITMRAHRSSSERWTETYRWHGNRLRLEKIEHYYENMPPQPCAANQSCAFTTVALFSTGTGRLKSLHCYQAREREPLSPDRAMDCAPLLAKIKQNNYVPPWPSRPPDFFRTAVS